MAKKAVELKCPKCKLGKILYILEDLREGFSFKIYKCYNCGYQENPDSIIKLCKYLETLTEEK